MSSPVHKTVFVMWHVNWIGPVKISIYIVLSTHSQIKDSDFNDTLGLELLHNIQLRFEIHSKIKSTIIIKYW